MPTWYQMPGMLGGRCGSPAISGDPVAERAPQTAQLLEPLASAGEADRAAHRVDLLDQRQPLARPGLLGDDRVVGG